MESKRFLHFSISDICWKQFLNKSLSGSISTTIPAQTLDVAFKNRCDKNK